MPKVSSRFRNRKINFKSAIPIYVGSLDAPFADDLDIGSRPGSPAPATHSIVPPPGYSINEQGETVRVETGVDKEEEHEHHLQAVISASAAALSRSTGPAALSVQKAPLAHIPTPDATGLVHNFTDYYKHNAYVDPHTYIRTSETVEESMGIAYTMDEDDDDFLQDYNGSAKENKLPPASANGDSTSRPASPVTANGHDSSLANGNSSLVAKNGHYPPLVPINGLKRPSARKDKGKEPARTPTNLTEDDFELVMDLFERITDRKTPTLHLDVTRIPSLEDLESSFPTYIPPYLLKIVRLIARAIYPHWKERRLKAGGKNIVPQLDFDETNETPYVCFRRREVKAARKTRRTDTQTLERLVRLRSDLSSAQEMLIKVYDRERCKRDATLIETRVFDARVRLRDTKRKLGENEGDEAVLIARREKRRKRDDAHQNQAGTNKIVIPNRTGAPAVNPGLLPEALPPYKDRTINATQRVEKDMQRKREQELGWEDYTDLAYLGPPQSQPSKFWRSTENVYLPAQDSRKLIELITFEQHGPLHAQSIGYRYRKRAGRGGRMILDRLAARRLPCKAGAEMEPDVLAKIQERWRYDSDAFSDIPSSRHPYIVDDFETKYAAARLRLVSTAEWESLYPSLSHVDDAFAWAGKTPDRLPPLQVIGKLPGQRVVPNINGVNGAVPNGQLSGQPQQQQQQRPPSNVPNQSQHAGMQAPRRSGSAAGPGTPIPNGQGLPQPPQIRRLMWENGAS